jgi:hypothetical protein
MMELHWTRAALLLAVAAPGGSTTRGRRTTEVSWDDFAREHGLGGDAAATGKATAVTSAAAPPVTLAPYRPAI